MHNTYDSGSQSLAFLGRVGARPGPALHSRPAGENCDEVTNLVSCDTSVLYPALPTRPLSQRGRSSVPW